MLAEAGAGGWGEKMVARTDDGLSALRRHFPACTAVPLLASMTNAAITHQDLSTL